MTTAVLTPPATKPRRTPTPEQMARVIVKHFPALSGFIHGGVFLVPSKKTRGGLYRVEARSRDGGVFHSCSCAARGTCTHLELYRLQVGPLDQAAADETVVDLDHRWDDWMGRGLLHPEEE